MKVSWDALPVFITACRTGSLTATADELGMAQSSVSEQIARLERTLGYSLLHRSSSGVRPTDRGTELAHRIADHVDSLAAATSTQMSKGSKGDTVFVGGPAEFLSEVVLPPLARQISSSIRVIARFGLADDLIDDLRTGAIDVLVSALPARGTDLTSQPIYDEQFVLVAHPDYADRAATDIDSLPVLAYHSDLPIVRRYWRSIFERRPTELDARVIAPDLRTLLRLAMDGAGMTVLPEYLVNDHLASGALALLHSPTVSPLNTLYLATRKTRHRPSAAIAAVCDAIEAIAKKPGA